MKSLSSLPSEFWPFPSKPFSGLKSRRSALFCARLARRQQHDVFRTVPAMLEIPPFRRDIARLSETVTAVFHPDGRISPGLMRMALAQGDLRDSNDAAALAVRVVAERVGGTYWADAPHESLLAEAGGGLSIVVAGGDDIASREMLRVSFDRVGAARTLLIPRVAGPTLERFAKEAGCRIAQGALDPWPLLDSTAEIHVAADDWLAVLGLLTGRSVHCHRPCWFSSYGLTTDYINGFIAKRDAGALASAALLKAAHYRDPFTAAACTASHAIELTAEWRRICDANRSVAVCVGMQFWKRRRIAQFLHTGVRAPHSARNAARAMKIAVQTGGSIAGWASRMPEGLAANASKAGVSVMRVEDGFLRSVGLGSDFMPPCSIVLDRSGLYYDPARPSDLEKLLATMEFSPALLARSKSLIQTVIQSGVTKYNTGTAALPKIAEGRRPILVTGQVSNDLSVRLGGGAVTENADLLSRARKDNPDAFILYRPHPDVDAGHRPGALTDAQTLRHADAIARGVPMAQLIGAVEEVHTITSLAGFEALLRGRKVVVWGQPFYAGWGLTQDRMSIPRRTRKLQIDQLTAGVLLLYPRYLDPETMLPCSAEVLISRLSDPTLWRPGLLVRARRLQGRLMNSLRRSTTTAWA